MDKLELNWGTRIQHLPAPTKPQTKRTSPATPPRSLVATLGERPDGPRRGRIPNPGSARRLANLNCCSHTGAQDETKTNRLRHATARQNSSGKARRLGRGLRSMSPSTRADVLAAPRACKTSAPEIQDASASVCGPRGKPRRRRARVELYIEFPKSGATISNRKSVDALVRVIGKNKLNQGNRTKCG